LLQSKGKSSPATAANAAAWRHDTSVSPYYYSLK
jgi:hypothetical protein